MQVLAAFECGVVPNNWLVVRWEKLLNVLITVSVTESLCITTSHFVSKCFVKMVPQIHYFRDGLSLAQVFPQ